MESFSLQQQIIDEVNQQIDPHELLNEINYFPEKRQVALDSLKCFCPLHKETKFRSLMIDINKKTYRCTFKTCSGYEGGRLIDLFARVRNISQMDAALYLSRKFELAVDTRPLKDLSRQYVEQAEEKIRNDQIPQAMGYLEQAISLDTENVPGLNLLADICFRHEEISRALELYLRLAEIHTQMNEVDEAIDVLSRRVLDIDSENERALKNLALLYEKKGAAESSLEILIRLSHRLSSLGRDDENIEICEKILNIAPNNVDACEKLARFYEAGNRTDLAVEHFWKLAKILHDGGNYKEARDILIHLKNLNPDFQEARSLLVDVAIHLKDTTLAERELIEIARFYHEKNELQQAVVHIQRLLAVNAHSIAGREMLLSIFIAQERIGDAIEQVKELHHLYVELDQEENALNILLRGKEIDPRNTEIRENLFNLYCEQGENQKAVDEGLELAEVFLETGNKDTADAVFLQTLGLAPQDYEMQKVVADRYLNYGIIDKAVDYYHQAAETSFARGSFEQSLDIIDKGLELKPDHVSFLEVKTNILFKLKRFDTGVEVAINLSSKLTENNDIQNAERILKNALELLPEEEKLLRHMARLYHSTGKIDQSIEILHTIAGLMLRGEIWEGLISVAEEILGIQPDDIQAIVYLSDAQARMNKIKPAVTNYRRAAGLFLKSDDYKQARACYEKAMALAPSDFNLMLDVADIIFEHEGTEKALSVYQKAVDTALAGSSKEKEVIRTFQRIILKESTLVDIRKKFVDYLISIGNHTQALEELETLADVYYTNLHDLDHAIQIYHELNNFEPDKAEISQRLAELYEEKGDAEKSAEYYRTTAQLHLIGGNEKKALEVLEKVITLKPSDEPALEELARISASLKKKDRAISYYSRLADIRLQKGQEDTNESIYFKMLELNPNLNDTRLRLAELLARCDEKERAAEQFHTLASFYIKEKRLQDAEKLLSRCLALNPLFIEAMDKLVAVYTENKKKQEALKVLLSTAEQAHTEGVDDVAQHYYSRAEILAPENTDVLEQTGAFYLAIKHPDKAVVALKKLHAIYKQSEEWEKDCKVLSRIKGIDPVDEESRKELAASLFKSGKKEHAAREWNDLLEVILNRKTNPEDIQHFFKSSKECLREFSDVSIALSDILLEHSYHDQALDFLLDVSSYLAEQKRFQDARLIITKLLNIEEDNIDGLESAIRVADKLNLLDEKKDYLKRLARCYYKQQDFKKAAAVLEQSHKLDANDAEVLNLLGECYTKFGNLENAEQVFFFLSRLYESESRIADAIKTDLRILEFQPENLSVMRHLADLYIENRQAEDAFSILSRIADILESKKAYHEVQKILERMSSIQPTDLSIIRRAVKLKKETDGIESARPLIQQVLETALRTFDSPDVLKEYQWALSEDSDNINLRLTYADYLEKIGKSADAKQELVSIAEYIDETMQDPYQAITVLEKARSISPEDFELCEKMGTFHEKIGDTHQAAEYLSEAAAGWADTKEINRSIGLYRKVIEIEPGFDQAYLRLAELLEQQNKKSESVQIYLSLIARRKSQKREHENIPLLVKILELEPERDELRLDLADKFLADNLVADAFYHYLILGQRFEEHNQLSKAISIYEKIKKIDPKHKEARIRLAESYIAANDYQHAKRELSDLGEESLSANNIDDAEKFFRRIIDIDPDDILTSENLGRLYEARGDITPACKEYMRVSNQYLEKGNPDKAIVVLSRVKKLMPDDIAVREKILDLLLMQGAANEAADESLDLAALLFSKGDKQRAVEYCKEINRIIPDSIQLIAKAVALLMENGYISDALEEYYISCEYFTGNRDYENLLLVCEQGLHDFSGDIRLHATKLDTLISLGRIDQSIGECFVLADLYSQSGAVDKVSECFLKILDLQPDNIKARQKYIEHNIEVGNTQEAISQIEQLVTLYINEGDWAAAQDYCTRALEIDPKHYSSREKLAEILCKQNNIPQALREYFNLATSLLEDSEILKARNVFEKILTLDPLNIDALVMLRDVSGKLKDSRKYVEVSQQLLDIYDGQGAITEAIEVAESIDKTQPGNRKIQYRLAGYYEQDHQSEQATAIYHNLAVQYEKEGNKQAAIDERLKIKRLNPEDVQNLLNLGSLYEAIGEIGDGRHQMIDAARILLNSPDSVEKSLSTAQHLISLDREDYDAHTICADALTKLHKHEEASRELVLIACFDERRGNIPGAIESLEHAVNMSPSSLDAREHLVELLIQQGMVPRAIEQLLSLAQTYQTDTQMDSTIASYTKILELDPEHVFTHHRLFDLLHESGKDESAIEHLIWLVSYYTTNNDLDKAEELLLQGLEINPDSSILQQRTAELFEAMGRVKEACVHWLKVAEINLTGGNIDSAITTLEKVKKFQPDNIETRRSLAVLYLHLGRREDYLNELLSVIDITLEQGLIEEGERYVRELTESAKDHPGVRQQIARLYLKHEIPEMAIMQYLKCAEELIEKEDYESARNMAQSVIDIDRESLPAREHILSIACLQKDVDLARTMLQELTELLASQNFYDKLLELLRMTIETFKNAFDIREQRATILEKINRIPEAVEEWRSLGEQYIKSDKLEKAADIYKHILQIAPDDTRSLQKYIDVYSRYGSDIDLVDDYILLARKYARKGAFQEADQTYQRLMKIAPDEPRILESYVEFLVSRKESNKSLPIIERLTEIYLEKGELRNAEKALIRIIESMPNRPDLNVRLADVYLSMNAKGKALAELQRASRLYSELGRDEENLGALRKIVNIFPDDTDTRQRLIEQLVSLGQIDEAVTESFTLADLYIKRGFLDLAESEYRRIINLQPNNFAAWNYLFDTHIQLGPEDELIEDYLELAGIHLSENQPEEAAKVYKKASNLQPRNIELKRKYIDTFLQVGMESDLIDDYMDMAELLLKENAKDEAVALYRKVLALEPDNTIAAENLVALVGPEEAVLKRGSAPAPVDADLDLPASEAESVSEDSLNDAIRNYQAILELNPQNARARCQLADIYTQLGKEDKAYAEQSQAARIFISKGELDKGIEIANALLLKNPTDKEMRDLLNHASLQRDSFKAIESAIEFIEKRKTDY